MTLTDFEITLDINMDAELACESLQGCENPSAWRLTLACCKASFNLCETCKNNSIIRLSLAVTAVCTLCDTTIPSKEFIYRVHRI